MVELLSEKGKCNATASKDILYNYVLPTLRQMFGDETHMGVIVRDKQVFSATELLFFYDYT